MNSDIYWSSIEYNYTSNSSQFGILKGGFLYAFVKASNSENAFSKIVEDLILQDIEVKEVEFVSIYDIETEWETEKQRNNFQQLYNSAQSSNKVCFDTFYAYKVEE